MPSPSFDSLRDALSLADAAKLFPTRPSIDTLRRWARKGLANGAKLRTFKVGGRVCTTRDAVEAFIAAANADPSEPRRQASAKERLRKLGI